MHILEKNVYDFITFQNICLISTFLLYIYFYTFIYSFLSYSQPKNMLTSSRLCRVVPRHHQRDASHFQLFPPSFHHGHGVILKGEHTVGVSFGELRLHLCMCKNTLTVLASSNTETCIVPVKSCCNMACRHSSSQQEAL